MASPDGRFRGHYRLNIEPRHDLMSSIAKTLVGSVMAMVRTEPTRDSGMTW